jgi:hypothetical protein
LLPPCGAEVSSSRRPQAAARDKNVGSSSRQAAHPTSEDQRTVLPRMAPSRTGTSESQRTTPLHADPPRRSEERPAPARQLYDGSDRPDSDSLQRHRSWGQSTNSASTPSAPQAVESGAAPRRLQSLLNRGGGAPDVHVPSSSVGAKDQLQPLQRPEGQPPSGSGSVLPSLRRQTEAEQPPSRRARSMQPPSRARRAARLRSPGCAPRCKFSSSDLVL